MANSVHVRLDEVLAHFSELEDPRSEINRRHPLESVLVILLMAVLAGCGGPTSVAEWANYQKEWLLKFLPLPNGIPQKDVYRRVLSALKPEAFQACFEGWLKALRERAAAVTGVTQPILAIDGKTLRRSHGGGLGALHLVSVWASEYGLSLGQAACGEKSNEITAIPEVLRLVDVSGAIVTIDAMGCQTAIAEEIIEREADYVLALKGNQETLHAGVIEYLDEQIGKDFAGIDARRHTTTETGHGREETRTYLQMPAPKSLPGYDRWKGLLTIGVALLQCVRDGKETCEMRYYISSLSMGVKRFARAVRGHWGIENECHWSLDFTYREDELRHREGRARENIAWLNRFTLSLLKQHRGKQSLVMKRRLCGWSDDFLMQVLVGSRS